MADVLTGSGSAIRSEAYVTGYNAAARTWTVHVRASFFEWSSSPSTFGSASFIVGGSAGVLASSGFSFDWRPGGLQSITLFETDITVTADALGNAPAGFHIDLYISDTGTSGGGGGGTSQAYVSFSPNPLKVAPSTPTSPAAVRNSDTQATVSWTTPATPTNGQPTSQKVRKSINGAAFDAGSTISPAPSVALAVAANQKLVFGVQSINSAGSSAWSADTTPIYTSPAAPTLLSATKVGSDIQLLWTANVAFTEHQHLIEHGVDVAGVVTWDGSVLATKASGTNNHTHVAPNPAQRHVYRVWAKNTDVAALESAKLVSNVVQLLTAPAKPTVATPPAFADKAAIFRFGWVHNSVDSSAQTKYQYRWSTNGGSSWATTSAKLSSVNQFHDFAASTWTANQAVTFQVRTKGAYDAGSDADASYSPWSDSVTVTFKTRPVATIVSPANASTYTQGSLLAVLGFTQAEAATFVSATIELYQGATLLESIVSTTLAGTQLATRVADGVSYTLKATVKDSNGLVSTQVSSTFSVDYTEPRAAVVTATYLDDSGIVQLALAVAAAGGGLGAARSVTIERSTDAGASWESVVTGYAIASPYAGTILDLTPTVHGRNDYRVTTRSVDGATTVVLLEVTTAENEYAFMNKGTGYSVIVKFELAPGVTATPTVDSALLKASGRKRPLARYATTGGLEVQGVGALATDYGSTPEEIEAFLLLPGKACYRDPTGRRVFGKLSGSLVRDNADEGGFQYTLTETD